MAALQKKTEKSSTPVSTILVTVNNVATHVRLSTVSVTRCQDKSFDSNYLQYSVGYNQDLLLWSEYFHPHQHHNVIWQTGRTTREWATPDWPIPSAGGGAGGGQHTRTRLWSAPPYFPRRSLSLPLFSSPESFWRQGNNQEKTRNISRNSRSSSANRQH